MICLSPNNKIITIVEDDQSNTLFFAEALKKFPGVTIFTFRDPASALEHFQEYDYRHVLVIADLTLQGLDGMEFLKKVKYLNPYVRALLVTAAFRIDDKLLQKYIKEKIIDGFVRKPIGLHDFLKEVHAQIHAYEIQKIHPY